MVLFNLVIPLPWIFRSSKVWKFGNESQTLLWRSALFSVCKIILQLEQDILCCNRWNDVPSESNHLQFKSLWKSDRKSFVIEMFVISSNVFLEYKKKEST